MQLWLFNCDGFRLYLRANEMLTRLLNPLKSLDGFLTGLGGNRGFRGTGGTPSAAPPKGEKRPLVRSEKADIEVNYGSRVSTELLNFIRIGGVGREGASP